ncbi:MAG TPA: ACT domain-containing protein [Ktedonobacteraceae bacterium]|jgi:hypothetical protein|nr:ACT domain-containing protein [Ktedonobacteraceae bacterium]
MKLIVLPDEYAICRLAPHYDVPSWALARRTFVSITCTADELSIVCPFSSVPQDIHCERGWRAIKVQGPLDFSLTGILASLAVPLAEGGVSIFAVSTFDTDYILVKDVLRARKLLEQQGHSFIGASYGK